LCEGGQFLVILVLISAIIFIHLAFNVQLECSYTTFWEVKFSHDHIL
jgi:hypothetical protein